MSEVLSVQEKIELYLNELQNQNPDLTDLTEGSIIDILSGVTAIAVDEADRLVLQRFLLANFLTATGQDLEDLAIDHFGADFARPGITTSTGVVTFSRPNTDEGDVVIPAGTIVRTATNPGGGSIQFETVADVEITGLTINASIQALEAGPSGNVLANKITVIETTLADSSITVNNADPTSGGAEEETDEEYRETIIRLIEQLPGATIAAIESRARAVAGIEIATLIEKYIRVSEIDQANALVGDPFRIPMATLYIGDANGNASPAQILEVQNAIREVRAAGVEIFIEAGEVVFLDWTASITLNAAGPNFAELSADPQRIIDSMTDYVNALPVGDDFIVADAETAILDIWGPTGTNDLTAFSTSIPAGDVDITATQKLIAQDVEIA